MKRRSVTVGTISFLGAAIAHCLLSWLVASPAAAQGGEHMSVSSSDRTGLATLLTSSDGTPLHRPSRAGLTASDVAIEFLNQNGQHFGISSAATELVARRPELDDLGFSHCTFDQVVGGIPVFSGVLKVHLNAQGEVTAANGHFYPISPKLNTVPAIDSKRAESIAQAQFPGIQTQSKETRLVIVDPGWYGDPPRGAHLAYFIHLADSGARVREAFFVDAQTGEILDQWTTIHRARDREIYTAGGGAAIPGTLLRSEGNPPSANHDVNTAYDYYGDVYLYYKNAFGRDSIDGHGLIMKATVQFDDGFTCPNAYWDPILLQMVFCQGLITDDIVGHELTHGVTQYTSGLIYQNQSGQLNESLSDIFGELIDLFNGDAAFAGTPGGPPNWPTDPTGPGTDIPNNLRTGCNSGTRWMLGEDASAFGGAIRDMWSPTCLTVYPNGPPFPDRANSPYMDCSWDNGGVHIGSSVSNHAFAIMTDGKTFNGQIVTGIGPIKAGAVWYRAQTQYFTPATDFQDAYNLLIQAANDLINTTPLDPRSGTPSASSFTSNDKLQVQNALIAVEMNTPGSCGRTNEVIVETPPVLCSNRTIIFSDNFEAGVNGWTTSVSSPPPHTLYQWVQDSGSLPFNRPGTAWFCADLNFSGGNESAVHSLISPAIAMPTTDAPIYVSFTHLMVSEGGWDGGNISYSTNNGASWNPLPRSVFTYNPYNGRLLTASQFNSNPLAGQESWTGAGGKWGTSILVDSDHRFSGQTVKFNFSFGNDSSTGVRGWYVDDFQVYTCLSCEVDGVPSDTSNKYVFSSLVMTGIGSGVRSFTIPDVPEAKSDVRLSATAVADLSDSNEYLSVKLGATDAGILFGAGGSDCPATPDREVLTIPMAIWNGAISNGSITVGFEGTAQVNPNLCGDQLGYVATLIEYDKSLDQCVHGPSLEFPEFGEVGICVNVETSPLGPEPLVTGGIPPLTYQWTMLSGPEQFDSTDPHPKFKPLETGEYILQLEVTDSSRPKQRATTTLKVLVGVKVTIDQGAYTRYHPIIAVGDTLQFGKEFTATGGKEPYAFHWSVTDDTQGATIISEPDSSNAAFSATQAGTYVLQLDLQEAGGCVTQSKFSVTVTSNGPESRSSAGAGDNSPSVTGSGCGAGTCGQTGTLSIVGLAVGTAGLRRRLHRRARRGGRP